VSSHTSAPPAPHDRTGGRRGRSRRAALRRAAGAGGGAIAAALLIVAAVAASGGGGDDAPEPDVRAGERAEAGVGPTESTEDTEGADADGDPPPPDAEAAPGDEGVAPGDEGDGTPDDPGVGPEVGAAPSERDRLVVHHVGDVNLDPGYVPILASGGPTVVWDGVRGTFAEASLVLVNLECAASELGRPETKQFTFRCDVDALPAMRDAGVDVATLANNHSGDFGMDAMLDSVTSVEAAGLAAVGVGPDEAAAYRPHVVDVAGWRVAILGFGGAVPEPWWTSRGAAPGQATGYDPARMAEAVTAARADADLVIATVHWGEEGSFEPRPQDVAKAEAMVAAGVDVVFGHHAHRLQPLEALGGVPVFWNLGNFVWPRTSPDAARTAVARWVVEPDGSQEACLLPFEIAADGVPAPTGAAAECTSLPALAR
jgi:hypothetical protein